MLINGWELFLKANSQTPLGLVRRAPLLARSRVAQPPPVCRAGSGTSSAAGESCSAEGLVLVFSRPVDGRAVPYAGRALVRSVSGRRRLAPSPPSRSGALRRRRRAR